MKRISTFLSLIVLLAGCVASNTTPTTKQVDKTASTIQSIVTKTKFLDNGTSLRVYVHLDLDRTATLESIAQELSLRYTLYPDFMNKTILEQRSLNLSNAKLLQNKENWMLIFDVPKPKELLTGVLVLAIQDTKTGAETNATTLLRFQSMKSSDYFTFFDKTGTIPYVGNYFTAQDTVILKSLNSQEQTFKAFRYQFDFDPAQSPMATAPRQAQRQLFVDSSFSITSNKLYNFKDEALFYFTKDTADAYGVGFVVGDKRYPRLTRPEKLVKPLIYMSTNAETQDLRDSKVSKIALDNYWLNLTQGNQQLSKRIIKAYFQRVAQANELFTSYKVGWKTDRGMVWIIMGTPTRVTKTRDKEIWTYVRNSQYSEVNFTFNKRANQFTDDHYELQRYAEFQSIWFPTVEQWRNGDVVVR